MRRQPVEQGVPNERVLEAVAGCHSLDHTPDERLVEKRIGLRLTDASYGDVFVGVELGSQHRDLGQGRNGCVAETPKHEGTRRTTSIAANGLPPASFTTRSRITWSSPTAGLASCRMSSSGS